MRKIGLHIFILTLIASVTWAQASAGHSENNNLKILNVQFEPIRQGKNVVRIKVKNMSEVDQIFRVHIYTLSPDYGRNGVGWGTGFFDTIKANATQWARFVFKIQGPVTDKTWIRLKFYNPASRESGNFKEYFEQKRYTSRELERYKADDSLAKPISEAKSKAITQTFLQIQNLIREQKYEQAWRLFTKDYQDAEFQSSGLEAFKRTMNPSRPTDSAFRWERDDFLKLQPRNVVKKDDVFVLEASCKDQSWTIDFVKDDGQLKIDWVAGYTPQCLLWQNWEERLLPKMKRHTTEHFDINYFKDSTAEKQMTQIVENREKGYREICDFLGKESDIRIRMVLFEDEQTKHWQTGHEGIGWAYGNTIVEVYNEQEQLDPYHEMTHVLMRSFGSPPALFNEGFAVYMSEKLGAHALEDLGGGQDTVYQRAKELKIKGQWIDLNELITYTEIGSPETQSRISYAESAAFVKFLIEGYGKDKFLRTYKTLKNSNNKTMQMKNIKMLEQIYGKSLKELQKEWESIFLK